MGLLDKWNKNKFSIYKSEEKTVLKLIESLGKWLEELIKVSDNKTDLYGDHKGSWQGLNRPTLSEEGMRATVEKLSDEFENVIKPIAIRQGNIKEINVLDYGVKNDGETDNTTIINQLISEGYTNLKFPKGVYLLSINAVSHLTIKGDGKNETILRQVGGSNKNVINIIDGVSHVDIKNLTIEGNSNNTKGHGIFIKGTTTEDYCNYIFLENVYINKVVEDGFHCEGYSVENKLTNCFISRSGKRNVYNEGHDLFMINTKLQRAGEENIITTGSNCFLSNLHLIYGNMLQKDLDKNSSSLKYSMVIKGSRCSFSNINCQDCFGHGVLIENAVDINLSNFLVDAVGINRDETEWWLPNAPNNCIGFNIKNSKVNASSCHVTNWHNNEQGPSYIIDGLSTLIGSISRNEKNNIVKTPVIKTENTYGTSFEEKLFEGMKNVLNKSTINWGYSLVHSGSPTYGSARYGGGVYFNEVAENMKLDITSMKTNNDFEISFTYTPKKDWDNTNTRWILYGDYNGWILECVVTRDGKLIIRLHDGEKYYSTTYNEVLTKEFPYRIFIKIVGDKFLMRVYKYGVHMGQYTHTLSKVPTNGTTVLYFGNNKTPQTWWSCNGIIEDIHISKAIPDRYDYKEVDTRIKVTPLTLFKANLNNSLT